MKSTGSFKLVLAVSLTALIAAACGSSSKQSSSPTTGAGGSATTAGSAATGSPIKLMSMGVKNNPAFSEPQLQQGAQARVAAINKAGGLNGHPIELITCDTNLDPNEEKACLEQAVSQNVSAVIASTILLNPLKILQDAGILCNGQGITPDELTNPISFPFAASIKWFYGEAAQAKGDGAKSAIVVSTDTASSTFSAAFQTDGLKLAGIKLTGNTVITPLAKSDYTPQAAEAIKGNPDAVLVNGPPETVIKITQEMKQAGYTGKIYDFGSGMTQAGVKTLGSAGNGVKVSLIALPASDTSDPIVQKYLADMKAFQPSATIDELSAFGWSSAYLFEQVMKNATSFDAKSVLAAYGALSSPVQAGVLGPFVGSGPTPFSQFPRAFNVFYHPGEIQNQAVVSLGEWTDAVKQLRGGS
jgi:branched-chain amino acid transport system substrate-binding protein